MKSRKVLALVATAGLVGLIGCEEKKAPAPAPAAPKAATPSAATPPATPPATTTPPAAPK